MAFKLTTPQGARNAKNIVVGAALSLVNGTLLVRAANVCALATTTNGQNQDFLLYVGPTQTTVVGTVISVIELFKNDELLVDGLSGNVATTVGNRVTPAAGGLTIVQGTDVSTYTLPAPFTVNGFISSTAATVRLV
jgi:hypothetical protein